MKTFTLYRKDGLEGFSFNAENYDQAISAVKNWCIYHSFCYEQEYILKEIKPSEALYNCSGNKFMHSFLKAKESN